MNEKLTAKILEQKSRPFKTAYFDLNPNENE